MFRYFYEALFILIGVTIVAFNFAFLRETPFVFEMLNLAGGLVAVLPPVWIFYRKFHTRKEIETQFLVFISDLTEALNSGMTLPLALTHVSKREYGALSPYVNKISSQVDWGIPFHKALDLFGRTMVSVPIKRAVETITQTYRVGGNLTDTLHAISESLLILEKIKSERKSSIHSQIITSYLIYFVFIVILVILQVFLVPSLIPEVLPSLPGTTFTPIQDIFSTSFINFILIQGFFAGLVTGKMAEGSIVAGIKHSVLLIIVGYTIFTVASQLQIRLI